MTPLLILVVVALAIWVWVERSRKRQATPITREPSAPGRSMRDARALDLSAKGGECDFPIVGEGSYQPELRRVAKSGRTFTAVLMAEPTNPHDPNAIRVCAEGGKTIGYLSGEYAVEYKEVLDLRADRTALAGAQVARLRHAC